MINNLKMKKIHCLFFVNVQNNLIKNKYKKNEKPTKKIIKYNIRCIIK